MPQFQLLPNGKVRAIVPIEVYGLIETHDGQPATSLFPTAAAAPGVGPGAPMMGGPAMGGPMGGPPMGMPMSGGPMGGPPMGMHMGGGPSGPPAGGPPPVEEGERMATGGGEVAN